MDAPAGKSAINRYDLNEHHVLNCHKENRTDYDLLSIITIYLGEEPEPKEDWLIRFLRILFKDTKTSPAEKRKVLKNEFDMDTTADMEEELMTMCNLSTGIYEEALERGRAEGIEQGKLDMILEMLKRELPVETIAQISNFPIKRIKELGKNIT
mgnify:FL=1